MSDAAGTGSRYELLTKIASGGMATVYVGRVRGAAGFWRLVAIKRAHPHLIEQPGFREMLVAEARLASRIHHTNVVSVLDVEEREGELLLVLDYVDGSSLAHLVSRAKARGKSVPAGVAARVVLDATAGLQAAHDLTDVDGTPLGVVHRDVSPHNVLIGTDGVGRIADFGIAKVLHQGTGSTASGVLKGKLSYMAPEYVNDHVLDVRSDVFGMGVVLWELLTGRPLFRGKNEVETLARVSTLVPPRISEVVPELGTAFDEVVARSLERDREHRYRTAGAFAADLEARARAVGALASHAEVAAFLKDCLGEELASRKAKVHASTRGETAEAVDEQTKSLNEAAPVDTAKAEAITAVESAVTLPSADVVRIDAPPPTGTDPLLLVRPAITADATQPSFAHSQIKSRSELGAPRRGAWWLGAVAIVALAAGAVVALRHSSSGSASLPDAPQPSAPIAPSAPREPEPAPVVAEPPASSPSHEPKAEPQPDAGGAPPRTRPEASPSRVKPAAPKPSATPAPPPAASAPAAPAPPTEWSPPDNPYPK